MKTTILRKSIIGICLVASLIVSNKTFAQVSTPDIKGIKDFDLALACELTLKQGDIASINIEGDEDALSELYFKTFGDKLIIKTHKKHQHKDDVKITLVVPDLNELTISGVVDLITPKTVNFNKFNLEVSGVAYIQMSLKSEHFDLDASGVLKGEIIGEVRDMKLDISGMGTLDASELKSLNCEIDISGMGNAEINVSENLDASVSGMGKIAYSGHPRVHANTSGLGRIRKK